MTVSFSILKTNVALPNLSTSWPSIFVVFRQRTAQYADGPESMVVSNSRNSKLCDARQIGPHWFSACSLVVLEKFTRVPINVASWLKKRRPSFESPVRIASWKPFSQSLTKSCRFPRVFISQFYNARLSPRALCFNVGTTQTERLPTNTREFFTWWRLGGSNP